MSEVDKRLELSRESTAMLAAMGVQVWHARNAETNQPSHQVPITPEPAATSGSEVSAMRAESQRADEAQVSQPAVVPSATVEPLEFTWVKGSSGMVLCGLGADAAALQLVRDIVVFGDWVRNHREAPNLTKGDFEWPQLLDTEGTPARALAVFVDKHWPQQGAWIALAAEVQPSVSKWLENVPVTVIDLPAVQASIRDAALKKTIWQTLKASA